MCLGSIIRFLLTPAVSKHEVTLIYESGMCENFTTLSLRVSYHCAITLLLLHKMLKLCILIVHTPNRTKKTAITQLQVFLEHPLFINIWIFLSIHKNLKHNLIKIYIKEEKHKTIRELHHTWLTHLHQSKVKPTHKKGGYLKWDIRQRGLNGKCLRLKNVYLFQTQPTGK